LKEIPLTHGKFAIVDDEDYEWLMQWKWHLSDRGYATRTETDPTTKKRKTIFMHRLVINTLKGLETDHIDKNRLNNTKNNLRICTPLGNAKNRGKTKKETVSKFKGVTWREEVSKWRAILRSDHKVINIGYFTNEIAAANAYNHYAKLHHGEFASLNEVEHMDNWMDYLCEKEVTSKYRGVNVDKNGNWKAYIKHGDNNYYLGTYEKEEHAAIAYNRKAKELLGDKAKLNDVFDTDVKIEKIRRKESSRYLGVGFRRDINKWYVSVYHEGKNHFGGFYNSEIEAANAYNEKAILIKGENAKLNNV
jgi:hypothetical protein